MWRIKHFAEGETVCIPLGVRTRSLPSSRYSRLRDGNIPLSPGGRVVHTRCARRVLGLARPVVHLRPPSRGVHALAAPLIRLANTGAIRLAGCGIRGPRGCQSALRGHVATADAEEGVTDAATDTPADVACLTGTHAPRASFLSRLIPRARCLPVEAEADRVLPDGHAFFRPSGGRRCA